MKTVKTFFFNIVAIILLSGNDCGQKYAFGQSPSSMSKSFQDTLTTTKGNPRIRTVGRTFRVPEGQKVELPCVVDNLGNQKVAWRKGNDILAAGDYVLTQDTRFRLLSTNSDLELSQIRPQDAGDFVCQVHSVGEILEVGHTVEVLVPPRVRANPNDGNIVVKKGSEITLECSASGNPVPTVTWSRENDLLPEGIVSGANKHGYTIKKVDRLDAGRFTCTATNGVGSPATAQINLQILYEPEIEIENEKVHSGIGKEAKISCIVHGEPKPTVRWFKESIELTSSSKIRMEEVESSHRHSLIIRGLASQHDFGNYSCVAENLLGSSKRYIEVHGRPTTAVFRSKPHQSYGMSKNSFKLTWSVESFSNIEEYRLLYRQIKPYHPEDGFSLNLVIGSDWTNIIIPGDLSDSAYHHEKTFLLTDLISDAQYECLVQAKNKYGWSEASRIHRFNTNPTSYAQEAAMDLGWKTSEASAVRVDWKALGLFITIATTLLNQTKLLAKSYN